MSTQARSALFFILAGLMEIGGGYLCGCGYASVGLGGSAGASTP